MHKPQEQVRELHRDVLEQPFSPAPPELRMAELRARLILEEAIETAVALVGHTKAGLMIDEFADDVAKKAQIAAASGGGDDGCDLVEAIDGLCDTLVVCYGTAEAIGIDLEPFFDEVHRSNMAKKGGEVRADGKKLKPPGWTPPDIAGVLDRVRRGAR